MSKKRAAVVRFLQVLPAWLAGALFFSGTLTLTGGSPVVWFLPSAAAIIAGVLGFTLWLIWYVAVTDALRGKRRRRPR